MTSDWKDEPSLRDVAEELRARVGSEIRLEAEEVERLAAVAERRRRTLADVAAALRDRGDTIAIALGGQTLRGEVTHVGSDYLQLQHTTGSVVDVPLSTTATMHVVERAPSGGTSAMPGPTTFRARLLEHEIGGSPVTVVTAAGGVTGHLEAVGRDHVVVRGGESESYVPIEAILAVRQC